MRRHESAPSTYLHTITSLVCSLRISSAGIWTSNLGGWDSYIIRSESITYWPLGLRWHWITDPYARVRRIYKVTLCWTPKQQWIPSSTCTSQLEKSLNKSHFWIYINNIIANKSLTYCQDLDLYPCKESPPQQVSESLQPKSHRKSSSGVISLLYKHSNAPCVQNSQFTSVKFRTVKAVIFYWTLDSKYVPLIIWSTF